MMEFKAGGEYRTRGGGKAKIIEHDREDYRMPYRVEHSTGDTGWHFYNGGGHEGREGPRDLIAEWTDAPAETGTLKELNVQPGDVVEYVPLGGRSVVGRFENGRWYEKGKDEPYVCDPSFRIISRATPSIDLTAITTPFGLLDEATQDALRAHGGPYERYTDDGKWTTAHIPVWYRGNAYRVKPAPKRETVTRDMWADDETGLTYREERPGTTPIRITVEKVDGKADWSTHRVEAR